MCEFSFSFFLREKGVRIGLVEGEDRRLELALVMICLRLHIPFSTGVASLTGKKQALLSVCDSSFSFCKLNWLFLHPFKFLAHCLVDGKGRAPFGRARTFWEGHAQLCLIGEKGRAPFGRACPIWKGEHLLEGPAPFGRACSTLTD